MSYKYFFLAALVGCPCSNVFSMDNEEKSKNNTMDLKNKTFINGKINWTKEEKKLINAACFGVYNNNSNYDSTNKPMSNDTAIDWRNWRCTMPLPKLLNIKPEEKAKDNTQLKKKLQRAKARIKQAKIRYALKKNEELKVHKKFVGDIKEYVKINISLSNDKNDNSINIKHLCAIRTILKKYDLHDKS